MAITSMTSEDLHKLKAKFESLDRFVVGTFAPEMDDIFIKDTANPDTPEQPVYLTMTVDQAKDMVYKLQNAIDQAAKVWKEYEDMCREEYERGN